MKSDGSNYAYSTMSVNAVLELKAEAQLQGLTDPNIVWQCTSGCYDKALKANGAASEGLYMPLQFVPFEEAAKNQGVKTFLRYVGADRANGFSVYGWEAGLAFGDAARAAVKKDGDNGLTRKAFLADGIPTLSAFNAGGMVGPVNIGSKTNSPCFILEQYRSGAFHRVYPKKAGTFDCKPSNRVVLKKDLIQR
jgi:hypothetical protein